MPASGTGFRASHRPPSATARRAPPHSSQIIPNPAQSLPIHASHTSHASRWAGERSPAGAQRWRHWTCADGNWVMARKRSFAHRHNASSRPSCRSGAAPPCPASAPLHHVDHPSRPDATAHEAARPSAYKAVINDGNNKMEPQSSKTKGIKSRARPSAYKAVTNDDNNKMGSKEEGIKSRAKLMMSRNHIPLGIRKDSNPSEIRLVSSMMICGRRNAPKCKRNIQLKAGEVFTYRPNREHISPRVLFIYEVGMGPGHAENLQHDIYIYVTCKGVKSVVGILSAANPMVQLDLILEESCMLSHTSQRKMVCFNGYEVKSKPKKRRRLYPDKAYWATAMKPSQVIDIDCLNDRKKYHLLKVYPLETSTESMKIHIQFDGKKELLGEILPEEAILHCRFESDDRFTLCHSSDSAIVTVSGYTVPLRDPIFELKELTDDSKSPLHFGPLKRSVDPEYCAWAKRRRIPTDEQLQVNVGTSAGRAPIIFVT